jgi:DNA invertase Pin-like site-specific DNA recombinase
MMADARAGRVQAVAVVALDRLHRSMTGAVSTVLDLDRIGVPVMSVREGWLDTQGPVRPLLVAIFGWVAEQERATLIERTKAGIARARREGKRLGRPCASPVKVAVAVAHHQGGASLRASAKMAGIGLGTLRRHLAA